MSVEEQLELKDAGELDAQIVPVADLVADLDFDGVAGAGTAASMAEEDAAEAPQPPSMAAAPRAAAETPVHLRKVRREILLDMDVSLLEFALL